MGRITGECITPVRPLTFLLDAQNQDAAAGIEKGIDAFAAFAPLTTIRRNRLDFERIRFQLLKPPLPDQFREAGKKGI